MLIFLRRKKLGKTSTEEISKFMKNESMVIRNDKLEKMGGITTNMIVRWGCTTTIPNENKSKVLNKASAIHLVSDKLKFRRILQESDLCPFTFFTVETAVYPCIIRPKFHAQGRKLFVANNKEELLRIITPMAEWYGSELIQKSAEYRVFVGSGRVIWVANKIPGNPTDIAWNVAQGGSFENVRFDDWHLRSVKIAIKGFNLSELDFGGVDVIVDKNDKAYIVEINAAPSQTSPYRQQCCAKYFDYIMKYGKNIIKLVDEKGGYKKFIHPAISNEARLIN